MIGDPDIFQPINVCLFVFCYIYNHKLEIRIMMMFKTDVFLNA